MRRTLLFILAFLPMLASADAIEIDGIYYNLDSEAKTAEVTSRPNQYESDVAIPSSSNQYKGDVAIPESVTYDDVVYSVTSIGDGAFRSCSGLTSVTIPNSVTFIGQWAFYNCSGLTSITIPSSVTSIGELAFSGCSGLTSVTIPNSVTSIGWAAFDGCSGLTSITIGDGVISIGDFAFSGCTSLMSITIPSGVTSIGTHPFFDCSGLQSIVIEKGNTVYDSREDCNAIIKTSDNELISGCTNSTIPNSVTKIGQSAFQNCKGLRSVRIPNSVVSVGQFAFQGCSGMTSITIPNSVTSIGSYAFRWCSGLTSITIPNSVTSIDEFVFYECSGLTSVTIPNSVTSIGRYAFDGCSGLTDVICYAKNVPTTPNDAFINSGIEKATLHVPAASISAYQAVEPWKNFKEIVALSDQGSNTDDSDYLPFVELGKQWNVTNTDSYPYNRLYCFSMHKEVECNGKTYVHTCYADDEKNNHYYELLREENKRVYKYDEWEEKEYLVYDFSLKEGDTFTYELMTHYPVEWKVLKQGWLEDGPDIVSSCTSNPDGTLDIKYRKLRTWTVGPKNEESGEYNEMATWVECVGSLEGMFAQYSTGGAYRLAYVERAEEMGAYWENNIYLPFSFYYDNYLFEGTRVHGCNLPTGKAELSEDSNHQLTYELEGDRLHVYGKVLTHGGPNNYAYFFEETTDDNSVRKLHFNIIEIEPLPDPKPGSDGMLLHATDFYVPGFNPNRNYYVIDNRGVEHPVINKTPQMAYRPFIEDDKAWAVKVFDDGMPTRQWIEYYYFDGDTIVNGHIAKRMLVASEQDTSGKYVGAWYEQDKKVYFAHDQQQHFELLYDFTLSSGDTIYEDEYMMYVVNKMSGGIPGFKGMYYVFLHNGDVMNRWLEGVGSESYPYINTMSGLVGRTGVLLVCKTGDEIIYYNSEEEDPYSMGAKKHRFDFTHTIKTKPKAPSKREKSDARINSSEREVARPKVKTRGEEEEQSLYGEYNNLLLGINLEPLDEAYLVRITNESDQVVYEKIINAGSIVGLNIDISAFAKGRYTVTMENSSEVFTGEFETITTGIQELKSSRIEELKSIYNLQGQRLNRLQKGLNIVGGRKVFVK